MKSELRMIANCFELESREKVFQFFLEQMIVQHADPRGFHFQLRINLGALPNSNGKSSKAFATVISWDSLEKVVHYFQMLYYQRYGFKNDRNLGIPIGFLVELFCQKIRIPDIEFDDNDTAEYLSHHRGFCTMHWLVPKKIAKRQTQIFALRESVREAREQNCEPGFIAQKLTVIQAVQELRDDLTKEVFACDECLGVWDLELFGEVDITNVFAL